jgi:hypothetical protein
MRWLRKNAEDQIVFFRLRFSSCAAAATPFLKDADGGGEGEGHGFSFADEIFSDVRLGEV